MLLLWEKLLLISKICIKTEMSFMPGSFEYIARQQHLHLNLNMAGALGGVNTLPYKILNSILGVPLVNAAHRRNISVEIGRAHV